jgi:hypothetical protein
MNQQSSEYIKQLEATVERLEKSLKSKHEIEDFFSLYVKILAIFMRDVEDVDEERFLARHEEAVGFIKTYPKFPPVANSLFERKSKDLLNCIKNRISGG